MEFSQFFGCANEAQFVDAPCQQLLMLSLGGNVQLQCELAEISAAELKQVTPV
jgi:hypothetical protein